MWEEGWSIGGSDTLLFITVRITIKLSQRHFVLFSTQHEGLLSIYIFHGPPDSGVQNRICQKQGGLILKVKETSFP